MFWRKARLIKELSAMTQTQAVTIRIQQDNIDILAKDREAKRVLMQEKMDEIATLTAELQATRVELNNTHYEFDKVREKLHEAQEETRLAREEAAKQARHNSFGILNEVNDDPGPEQKAEASFDLEPGHGPVRFEEPSPGVGDYQSGRTHPAEQEPRNAFEEADPVAREWKAFMGARRAKE